VNTGITCAAIDSRTYVEAKLPPGFHVAHPEPVSTPPARY
jgi:hypothetical protein